MHINLMERGAPPEVAANASEVCLINETNAEEHLVVDGQNPRLRPPKGISIIHQRARRQRAEFPASFCPSRMSPPPQQLCLRTCRHLIPGPVGEERREGKGGERCQRQSWGEWGGLVTTEQIEVGSGRMGDGPTERRRALPHKRWQRRPRVRRTSMRERGKKWIWSQLPIRNNANFRPAPN